MNTSFPPNRPRYSATTQQFASVGTRACQASDSASDKQCHVCLAMNAAGNVNLWDCMTEPGHKGQLFDYDPKTSGAATSTIF